MKHSPSKMGLVGLFCIVTLSCFWNGSASGQQLVTVNFNKSDGQDYRVYTEHGFSLTPNVGKVRVNDAFPPGSMAAQPSFGFGQGMDSSFTFRNQQHRAFRALSIDLLEATGFPATFGVTMIGTRANSTTVTQTFTMDGIEGAQTFAFSPDFTNLVSLKIAKDDSDPFDIDIVQIDNVRFLVPFGATGIRTQTGIYGQSFITQSNASGGTPLKIPSPTLVLIYNTQSKLVALCASNPAGEFSAYLRPGDYTLVGVPMRKTGAGALARLRNSKRANLFSDPVAVSVFPDQFTSVELDLGTTVP